MHISELSDHIITGNNMVLLIALLHTWKLKSEEVLPCPMCTADHCADIATSSHLFPRVSIRPMTLRPTSYHFLLIYMNSSHHFRSTTSYYRLSLNPPTPILRCNGQYYHSGRCVPPSRRYLLLKGLTCSVPRVSERVPQCILGECTAEGWS